MTPKTLGFILLGVVCVAFPPVALVVMAVGIALYWGMFFAGAVNDLREYRRKMES